MVESQFLLHPRAGPALEAGVIFFFALRHLRALRLPLMPYGIFFHACTVGLCNYDFLSGWLQCLRDAVDWGRRAVENNSLLVVFVYCDGRLLSAVLCVITA